MYDRYGLVGRSSVFAHDVHASDRQLGRLAEAKAAVAHRPSSNAFLGSGLFPMAAHAARGVHFALGSDVGGGTGFSLFKEGLMAPADLLASLFTLGDEACIAEVYLAGEKAYSREEIGRRA